MSPQKQAAERDDTADISEFLLRACHDLRSSLRSIHAHAELLLKGCGAPPPSDLEERLGFIVDGARRIDLLVDGLASYSLALLTDKGTFQPVPLNVIVRTVLTRLDKELRSNNVTVSCEKLPRVSGDPDRLISVFENLLRNTLHHRGPASPRIEITAGQHADGWLLAVSDNGPGVEAAYLESIFRPFERLHGKDRPGLGLAICRVIVERHGGRIWAESNGEAGCKLLFTLPAD